MLCLCCLFGLGGLYWCWCGFDGGGLFNGLGLGVPMMFPGCSYFGFCWWVVVVWVWLWLWN